METLLGDDAGMVMQATLVASWRSHLLGLYLKVKEDDMGWWGPPKGGPTQGWPIGGGDPPWSSPFPLFVAFGGTHLGAFWYFPP